MKKNNSPKSLSLKISIWYRKEDKRIHMRIDGQKKAKMTTIADDNSIKRGHRHLFNHLKEELLSTNKWFE